ncbi:E3 SUMO-protein ligase MMS21-like [Venturia canescens]|uniref:E3 SUMO-protein ligase MMS21-like n=1 Tax=Venturia canescens TaxID=32260 RepID=UPI001C9C3373|nr:E3 SUMO-protein ligase MMS21-like [Venturia canescens]
MQNLKKLNERVYRTSCKTAAAIITYYEGEKQETMLAELREQIVATCSVEEVITTAAKISSEISQHNSSSRKSKNPKNEKQCLKIYKDKIASIEPDPSKNMYLQEFDRVVRSLKTELNGSTIEADGDDDEGIQLTRDPVNVIDPVSKTRMTDPMRNLKCSHVYDSKSVKALLAQSAGARCPVPGCKSTEFLAMENMVPDLVTKIYLERHPVEEES